MSSIRDDMYLCTHALKLLLAFLLPLFMDIASVCDHVTSLQCTCHGHQRHHVPHRRTPTHLTAGSVTNSLQLLLQSTGFLPGMSLYTMLQMLLQGCAGLCRLADRIPVPSLCAVLV